MKVSPWVVLAAVTVSASLSASPAMAQTDPVPDREGASVGVQLGYGFDDAYKFGLGVRGGYTLPQIYVGGTFVYHFGESESAGGVSVSEHLLYVGPEGGYDFVIPSVPQLLIRPYLGLGFESVSFSNSGNEVINGVAVGAPNGGSASGFSFWPGVTGLYSFTPNWSAGLDARVVVATFGNGDTTFALFLAGQYKF